MNRAALVALLCALLGAGALHLYLRRYELEVAGGAPYEVVVATRDLALGEVITRSLLDLRELPERYLEERHITAEDQERIIGTRTTSAVRAGTSLLWSDLDVAHEGRTLAGLVRAGMRAYSLPERDVSFEGLLRPGDRVDVLFTPEVTQLASSTLVQNALVLTVGDDLGSSTHQGDAVAHQPGRVTLSVTLEQAQVLAHNEQRGTLRLALRNPQDLAIAHDEKPHHAAEPQPKLAERSER